MWQDWVMGFGNVLFFISLMPSVFSNNKPSIWTSLLTAIVLSVFAPTFLTMGCIFTATTIGMSAIAWWVLFFQVLNVGGRIGSFCDSCIDINNKEN